MEESSNLYLRTDGYQMRCSCDSGIEISLTSISLPFGLPTFTPRCGVSVPTFSKLTLVASGTRAMAYLSIAFDLRLAGCGQSGLVRETSRDAIRCTRWKLFYVWTGMGTSLLHMHECSGGPSTSRLSRQYPSVPELGSRIAVPCYCN